MSLLSKQGYLEPQNTFDKNRQLIGFGGFAKSAITTSLIF